ncbi:ABC transporter ATP-binding protein [Leucobacter soli]|uniref:Daunorubicin/doxorubicin resistance ATP-binding protein DrrA n=1 Tax=Leucobacter soli TaxID=2812850 RepID=A0A916NL29_9MICO|nr:ATP-binding cassette domain-containing protein [Leucobacter soli]CAG7597562.1 Daunorubicin/doxorubicin resistance ATP-binding protein DrrA [Leucobacter soli]
MSTTIELERLGKRYRGHRVLDDLTLDLSAGIFALLGPNGAGKTTLVSILTTLLRPDSGTARVLGHDVVHEAKAVRRLIGATGQYASVDEALTGRENLVMVARLLGLATLDARSRASELLASFGLEDAADRPVSGYSGGMRRRVDLAASLVRTPAVLFLDEPTTGLDPASRSHLWDDIARLASEGCSVFLTTQMLDEAEALADRVAILDGGRIVADGTVASLVSLVGEEAAVLVDAGGRVARTLEIDRTAGGLARALADLSEDERAMRVELRRPGLDDAFLALTGRNKRTPAEEEAAA